MRKWIAKSMSMIDYLVNKRDNEKELSFSSEDLCLRETFEGFDLSRLDYDEKVNMYFHKDTSITIDLSSS